MLLPDLNGQRAIVTGANSGLGFETAKALAGAGADVVVAVRNAAKGREAIASLRGAHPDARLELEDLDVSSLASVRSFADRQAGRGIDLLVNNAGVMAIPERRESVDGLELQWATNYVGPYALTARLLPELGASRGRVVMVGSVAAWAGRIHWRDPNHTRRYSAWAAYGQTKLADVMFALELEERSRVEGWGISARAAHPGLARTELVNNGPLDGKAGGGLRRMVGAGLGWDRFGHAADAGSLPVLMAATDAEGAMYFGPHGTLGLAGPPVPAKLPPAARRAADRRRLFDETGRAAGVAFP
jgi:NAD(P)-dependent dehydrogenase (short-subunit alcohol dehydrogenase family)